MFCWLKHWFVFNNEDVPPKSEKKVFTVGMNDKI